MSAVYSYQYEDLDYSDTEISDTCSLDQLGWTDWLILGVLVCLFNLLILIMKVTIESFVRREDTSEDAAGRCKNIIL